MNTDQKGYFYLITLLKVIEQEKDLVVVAGVPYP